MYAIRSYYGVIAVLAVVVSSSIFVIDESQRGIVVHRITSYNVCYTKLLRSDVLRLGQVIVIPAS